MSEARSRLIVALDVPDRTAALAVVDQLAGRVGCFKVGLELFTAEGPSLVEELRARGERVFLDLKLHDIPNTVAGAVRAAGRLRVQMLTVHVSGGLSMLEAAREAAATFEEPPLLVGVTALTSLSSEDVEAISGGSIEQWVDRLGNIALAARLGGLVSSAHETARLKASYPHFRLVVPGIRPAGADRGDQARAAEPREAIRAGADYLVVGRPILRAGDPAAAADAIAAEVARATAEKG